MQDNLSGCIDDVQLAGSGNPGVQPDGGGGWYGVNFQFMVLGIRAGNGKREINLGGGGIGGNRLVATEINVSGVGDLIADSQGGFWGYGVFYKAVASGFVGADGRQVDVFKFKFCDAVALNTHFTWVGSVEQLEGGEVQFGLDGVEYSNGLSRIVAGVLEPDGEFQRHPGCNLVGRDQVALGALFVVGIEGVLDIIVQMVNVIGRIGVGLRGAHGCEDFQKC